MLVFSGINYFSDLDSRFIARLQNSRLVSRDVLQFFFLNMLTVTLITVEKVPKGALVAQENILTFIVSVSNDVLDDKGDNIMDVDNC